MDNKYTNRVAHYVAGRTEHHPDVTDYLRNTFDSRGTVLELGSGTGLGTGLLKDIFQFVTTVEPVPAMLEINRAANGADDIAYICSDVEDLDIEELTFDYLICFQATHWFYKTAQYAQLYKRVKSPVLDICNRVKLLEHQDVVGAMIPEITIADSYQGYKYPNLRVKHFSRLETMRLEKIAHGLCSASWVDHTKYDWVLNQLTERVKSGVIETEITTEILRIDAETD